MKWAKLWLEFLTSATVVVIVVATFLQVIFRFALKIPAPWTEEVARIAFIYMILLGSALGAKYHQHLNVDIIQSLPKFLQKWVVQTGYVCSIIFIGAFTYYGLMHTIDSRVQTTPAMEISMVWMYMSMPISGSIMLYYIIKQFILNFRLHDFKMEGGGDKV